MNKNCTRSECDAYRRRAGVVGRAAAHPARTRPGAAQLLDDLAYAGFQLHALELGCSVLVHGGISIVTCLPPRSLRPASLTFHFPTGYVLYMFFHDSTNHGSGHETEMGSNRRGKGRSWV